MTILFDSAVSRNVDFLGMTDAEFEVALFADIRPADLAAVKAAESRASRRAKVARPSDLDRAWELGYTLGESGHEIHEVGPPSSFGPSEMLAFAEGLTSGIKARWDDYARHLEEQARLGFLEYEPEEHELAESGSCVGHAG